VREVPDRDGNTGFKSLVTFFLEPIGSFSNIYFDIITMIKDLNLRRCEFTRSLFFMCHVTSTLQCMQQAERKSWGDSSVECSCQTSQVWRPWRFLGAIQDSLLMLCVLYRLHCVKHGIDCSYYSTIVRAVSAKFRGFIFWKTWRGRIAVELIKYRMKRSLDWNLEFPLIFWSIWIFIEVSIIEI
jgi:hypothetical protein